MNESFSNNRTFGLSKVLISDEFLIPTGIFIAVENCISFIVLLRCNRLNSQIRILNINLCISDLSLGIFLSIPVKSLSIGGTCIMRKYFTALFIHATLLIITMFNVDRGCVLYFGVKYYRYINRKCLLMFFTLVWIFAIVITYCRFFDSTTPCGISCKPVFAAEHNVVTELTKWTLALILAINLATYFYFVIYIRNRFIRVYGTTSHKDLAPSNQLRLLGKVSLITGYFILSYFPYMLTALFPLLDYNTQHGKLTHTVLLSGLVLNSAVNPFLYILRFREAIYQMKYLLCFWNEAYIDKLNKQYKEQYATYEIRVPKLLTFDLAQIK